MKERKKERQAGRQAGRNSNKQNPTNRLGPERIFQKLIMEGDTRGHHCSQELRILDVIILRSPRLCDLCVCSPWYRTI